MNIEVTKHSVNIDKDSIFPHEGEYNINNCHFTFDEYTELFTFHTAIFTILSSNKAYTSDIINGECIIPPQVLNNEYDTIKLGVYSYNTEISDEEVILKNRNSPHYDTFVVQGGSYEEGAETPPMITPSQYEEYSALLQEGLDKIDEAVTEASNLDLDASKSGKISTITITKKDGTQKQVTLEDGMGLNYNWEGTSLGVKREDESSYSYTDLKGDKGDPGSVSFEIVEELPTQDIKEDTIYLVPYAITTVQSLPSTGQANTIYIVESTGKRYVYESNQWIEISSDNKYTEYIWVNNSWEILGGIDVNVDLNDYYTKSETNTLLNEKQNTIDSNNKLSADLIDDSTTTNKFTNANDITKLSGIESGAEVNDIDTIKVNGNIVTPISKEVDISVPTTLAGLSDDSTHRLVTDTEKSTWNSKQDAIDSSHKLSSDLVDDTNNSNKFVSSTDKTNWNAKYDKPSGGIPKTDLASTVQTSLEKADSALQSESDPIFSASASAGITSTDITNWNGKVSPTDYATTNTGGVVKIGNGISISGGGVLYGATYSNADYLTKDNGLVISKGTLENVITGKNLETANNKVTSISSASTDTQYPSAKCVYNLIGDVESILQALDVGSGV